MSYMFYFLHHHHHHYYYYYYYYLKWGLYVWPWLAWKLLHSLGWP